MKTNFFLERYKQWGFPQEMIELPIVIRINTLKKEEEQIIKSFAKEIKLEKIPYLLNGYTFIAPFSAVSTPQYLKGEIYIQEAASQIPAIVLDVQPQHTVLDMCAAPGSKTTQIAQLMQNQGTIVACDIQQQRLQKISYNLERCGVTNTVVIKKDGIYCRDLGVKFDRILLDAPCSGNFVIDKDWFDKRQPTHPKEQARIQKNLLDAAFAILKPDGILVYATCSLEIEENEQVIEHALKANVELVETGLKIGSPGLTEKTKLCRRLWPSLTKTQGFFIAKMRKKA